MKKSDIKSPNDHFNSPSMIDSQLKEQVILHTETVSEQSDNVHHTLSETLDAVNNKINNNTDKKVPLNKNNVNGKKKDNKNGWQKNNLQNNIKLSLMLATKLKLYTLIDSIQGYILKYIYAIKIIFTIVAALILFCSLKKFIKLYIKTEGTLY